MILKPAFSKRFYIFYNLLTILSLIFYLFVGFVYSMEGTKNTAIVFGIIYIIEKYTELHFTFLRLEAYIWVFFMSIFGYWISLKIH